MKLKLFQIFLFLLLTRVANGQPTSDNYQKKENDFTFSCSATIRYPREADENGISGTVIVGYDIDFTCGMTNIKIEKSIGYGCDEEALRVVNIIANCTRVKINLRKVKCTAGKHFTMPFTFKGQDEE